MILFNNNSEQYPTFLNEIAQLECTINMKGARDGEAKKMDIPFERSEGRGRLGVVISVTWFVSLI